jgi:hypothetical protein
LLDAAGDHRGIAAKLRLKASDLSAEAEALSVEADECQRAAALLRTREAESGPDDVPHLHAASEDLLACLTTECRTAAADALRQAAELDAEAELYEGLVTGLERDACWLHGQAER